MSYPGINPTPAAGARDLAGLSLADILAGLRARIGLVLRVTVIVVAAAVVIVSLLPTLGSSVPLNSGSS